MRELLLKAGAKNLREFGYPDATPENIISIGIFRTFFRKMVEEILDQTTESSLAGKACRGLLDEMDKADTEDPKATT